MAKSPALWIARVGVSLCLIVAPQSVRAAQDPGVGSEPELHAAARALYERGKAEYETADYGAAIELWTEAYGSLPDNVETSHIKTLLMYDIARAQERAFDVDRQVEHLRQAKILLQRFRESIPALHRNAAEAAHERRHVDQRLAALERKIRAAEGAAGVSTTRRPSGRAMIGSGAALLGVGAATLGLMTAGLVLGNGADDLGDLAPDDLDERRRQFDRGRAGNLMAIVGGALAGASIVSGAILLAFGLSRRAAAKTVVAPTLGESSAGLLLHGRF